MTARYYPAPGLAGLAEPVQCPPGQVPDFDPETGQFIGGCVDDTPAYHQGGYPVGEVGNVNITPGPDRPSLFPTDMSTWLMIAAGGLFVWFVIGGRRGR